MNWLMSRAVSKKGMASPAEYTARRRTPRAIVSLAAASARTAVRMCPMQGVHPKANAKPSRKPLQIPGCAMLLRRCTSRLSQRAKAGPKNPIRESEKKSKDHSDAQFELDERADEVQAKEKNQCAGNGSQEIAVLFQERADSARGSAECYEYHGKSRNKGHRRGKESRTWNLALAQLLHADAGEHRDVAGH